MIMSADPSTHWQLHQWHDSLKKRNQSTSITPWWPTEVHFMDHSLSVNRWDILQSKNSKSKGTSWIKSSFQPGASSNSVYSDVVLWSEHVNTITVSVLACWYLQVCRAFYDSFMSPMTSYAMVVIYYLGVSYMVLTVWYVFRVLVCCLHQWFSIVFTSGNSKLTQMRRDETPMCFAVFDAGHMRTYEPMTKFGMHSVHLLLFGILVKIRFATSCLDPLGILSNPSLRNQVPHLTSLPLYTS